MTWLATINAVLSLAGDNANILAHATIPWRSATFSGTYERLTLSFVGMEAITIGEAFLVELPAHDFDLPRHIVTEAKIIWRKATAGAEPRLDAQIELTLLDNPERMPA